MPLPRPPWISRFRGNDDGEAKRLRDARVPSRRYALRRSSRLKSVDYRIAAGEIVACWAANASGKSTTMKAIMGSVAPSRGEILYEGHSLKGVSTAERVRRGIAPVLEARRLFRA